MGALEHGLYSSDKVAVFKFTLKMKNREEKSILLPSVVERISLMLVVVDNVFLVTWVWPINSQQLFFIDVWFMLLNNSLRTCGSMAVSKTIRDVPLTRSHVVIVALMLSLPLLGYVGRTVKGK